MKYFTKEIYKLSQINAIACIEENLDANNYSENMFRELYQKKMKERIEDPDLPPNHWTEEDFEIFYQFQLTRLQECLSADILKDVADIRVLALGRATPDVKKKIKAYCDVILEKIKELSKEYSSHYNENIKNLDNNFIGKLHFHDAKILATEKNGHTMSLIFNNIDFLPFEDECKHVILDLVDYNIIQQEHDLRDFIWLYEEIFYDGETFELHVLLYSENDTDVLSDFIVKAKEIKIRKDRESRATRLTNNL